jgi:hypothetical protein
MSSEILWPVCTHIIHTETNTAVILQLRLTAEEHVCSIMRQQNNDQQWTGVKWLPQHWDLKGDIAIRRLTNGLTSTRGMSRYKIRNMRLWRHEDQPLFDKESAPTG